LSAAIVFWISIGLIAYAYLGYPALLSLLALTRPKQSYAPSHEPTITLLIAAHNEEAVIEKKLENSLALDYPKERLQILVAVDGAEDETAAIVGSYAGRGVELSHAAQRSGKMAAINRAMEGAHGEIVVFSDANNLYSEGTLREIAAPFAQPEVGAVSGAKQVLEGDGVLAASEGLYWKYESFIKQQETRLSSCTAAAGEVLAIRRELFQAPPSDTINDDFFIAMQVIRQGYRVVYAPGARSYERVSPSPRDERTRRARIVAGRFQALARLDEVLPRRNPWVVWQVLSHKFLRPLVPWFMAAALLANLGAVLWPSGTEGNALAMLRSPYNGIFLALQLTFYGLAWLGRYVKLGGYAGKLLFLPTYLLNSNLAAVEGLLQFLRGQHSPQWERVPRHASTTDEQHG